MNKKCDFNRIIVLYPGGKDDDKEQFMYVSNLSEKTPGTEGDISFTCMEPTNKGDEWVSTHVECFGRIIKKQRNC